MPALLYTLVVCWKECLGSRVTSGPMNGRGWGLPGLGFALAPGVEAPEERLWYFGDSQILCIGVHLPCFVPLFGAKLH